VDLVLNGRAIGYATRAQDLKWQEAALLHVTSSIFKPPAEMDLKNSWIRYDVTKDSNVTPLHQRQDNDAVSRFAPDTSLPMQSSE